MSKNSQKFLIGYAGNGSNEHINIYTEAASRFAQKVNKDNMESRKIVPRDKNNQSMFDIVEKEILENFGANQLFGGQKAFKGSPMQSQNKLHKEHSPQKSKGRLLYQSPPRQESYEEAVNRKAAESILDLSQAVLPEVRYKYNAQEDKIML
jgi:hypothetical protein